MTIKEVVKTMNEEILGKLAANYWDIDEIYRTDGEEVLLNTYDADWDYLYFTKDGRKYRMDPEGNRKLVEA